MAPETPDQARERLRPYIARARGFSGWSFDIHPKPLGEPHPWDYMARARELVLGASSVLDIGTGGGERFSQICSAYEGYAPANGGQ